MKFPRINFRLLAAGLALSALGGALLAWVSGMPYWGGAAIVAAALVVNGAIARVEGGEQEQMADVAVIVQALIGKRVSHIWRGLGSAILLEFGELAPGRILQNGKLGQPDGELTLMIEWSWRIENPRSILGGSWSAEDSWQGMFDKLLGTTVTDVEFFGHIPEICVSLDNGCRVISFSTVEDQPEWAVLTRKPALGSLRVKEGRLSVDPAQP